MAETTSPSRRRWFRFSLRTMLLAMLVTGGSLGWTLHKVREQAKAVAALVELGCSVEYASDEPLTVLERLRMWCGEKEYRNVIWALGNGEPVSDAGLAHLEQLTQLEWLELNGTQVTDAGLAHLERLTRLRRLELEETQITDAGLSHLERLTQLQSLDLGGTQIIDAGLAHLERLTQLGWLSLDGTRVTDAGLAHLERLTQLNRLYLNETQVTGAGVDKLQQALPRLYVEHSWAVPTFP